MRFSPNIEFLQPSPTLALQARARQMATEGLSIIDLSAGEPSFPTPEPAVRGALQAIQDGQTGYPPTPGIPSLREGVARYAERQSAGDSISASNVLVSAGVKQALFNVLYCLFGPGDEVIVPSPYWPTYLPAVRLSGATPVTLATRWEDSFRLDPDQLEGARTASTRAVLLNSPSNPSGAVVDADSLKQILDWADANGIWVLSDEIYRRLAYVPGGAPSVLAQPDRPERLVVFDGVSKTFSMTGWRIGYAVGPEKLIAKASALQSQTTSGAAAPSQFAAAELYRADSEREEGVADTLEVLTRRRKLGHDLLSGVAGLETRLPDGAIFFFSRATQQRDSLVLAEELLTKAGVACVPGEPFGTPGHLRFNFAVDESTLEEGLRRVAVHMRGGSS
ncbi:MAG: pyridoxal phosphate-dependent aminotransferase [Gemmatimonadota bacterium]